VVQAIIVNFAPLLFVFFQDHYNISLAQVTLLLTLNFVVQLSTDLLSTLFVDRIGYRASMMIANLTAAAGLVAMTILPEWMDPFAGLLISVCIYAVGGGIIEVLVSPIVESCPTENKEKAMSLLHSFYCWGLVGTVLISTVFFRLAGIHNWKIMAIIWAVIPVLNAILFSRTPIAPLINPGEKGMGLKELVKNKLFWVLIIMMICSGASENGVVLWSSSFAEKGLKIDKTLGDIAGPMAFAVVMGIARNIHGKHGEKMNLDRLMFWSTVLCIVTYLLMTLFRSPVINLIGCALCGVSVAIMWPGTLSKAAASMRNGGTVMFAMLAVAGDIGCTAGSTVVGMASNWFGGNMKAGILTAILFPVVLLICILLLKKPKKKTL
jgi:fucose permease